MGRFFESADMASRRADMASRRADMVRRHLAGRDITDPDVLRAMGAIQRERFVPRSARPHAYDDRALPIGAGQTISQPYIVALMTQALELDGSSRVLEIGTGSGYAAAVLGEIAARVDTVERHRELAVTAAAVLAECGYDNVAVHEGDGSLGWPDGAPYDAIVVTASAPSVPEALVDQLAEGGRLVLPVGGGSWDQRLVRVRRRGASVVEDDLGGVAFVPLIGVQGWNR
jgi:protein-L-isoaspartate(D-aspartate) O-methyltransferase